MATKKPTSAYERLMGQAKATDFLDGKPIAEDPIEEVKETPIVESVVDEPKKIKQEPNKVKPVVERAPISAQPLIKADVPTYQTTGNVNVFNANTGLTTSMTASAAQRLCRQSPKTYQIV